jgi:DNA ligase 3
MPKDAKKRIYNLQSKQIVKLFSRIFNLSHQEMLDDLSRGDVSETVANFFGKSKKIKPASKSSVTIMEVDEFLQDLSDITQEEQQAEHFEKICKKCTVDDLKIIIRLIKHDLKMNCGARHVLDALHPDAYSSFQKSRDIKIIIKEYGSKKTAGNVSKSTKSGLQVMTAISPMLAEPCKDFDRAIKKCPEGFYSEIKYDGERVQIHKKGNEFKFFSRNLKMVLHHKVSALIDFLPQAFPHGNDLILDSEILMVDKNSGELLPFGTLGKHKKEEHSSAVSCLFIFDCLLFNGEDLTQKTMKERRKFLEDNLTEIKNHVQLSEYKLLKTKNELVEMTKDVLKKGLEGLVLKGLNTIYEPGKRRWLKVKKDYLLKGAIADTADLVVLGAWYGTGKMGGTFSIFLMGCYDRKQSIWKTVTKVHSGLTDKEMEKMHKKISPIMKKFDTSSKIPSWIQLNRAMFPNAITRDPFEMPVFEVTGAEFTQSDVHTANSISIRFPRITKVREDKSPEQATDLEELTQLYKESKSGLNLDELNKLKSEENDGRKEVVTGVFTKLASSTQPAKSEKNAREKLDDDNYTNETPADKDKVKQNLRKSDIDTSSERECKKRSLKEDALVEVDYHSKKLKADNDNIKFSTKKIFKGFLLFLAKELKEKYDDEIEVFQKLGGTFTNESKAANLVLHENEELSASVNEIRNLYDRQCKHYQVKWLRDSVEMNELKNPLKYFVKLHQI